jgi:CheY-like chemotaxis protein
LTTFNRNAPQGAASEPDKPRVLLVDDDDDDNFFHRRSIEKAGLGIEVSVCADPEDALALLLGDAGAFDGDGAASGAASPDLIFLDLNMPGLSGWDFVDELAANIDRMGDAAPVIILLSTAPDSVTRRRADESPWVADTLAKPLRPDDVHRIAREHLRVAS